MTLNEHLLDLPLSPEQALVAVGQAAELWGANWWPEGTGGRLELPVSAGLRRGLLESRVFTRATATGSRVTLRVETEHYRMHFAAIAVLAFGALGGLAFTLWPFFPVLLGFAPISLVLVVGAWLLVASRLRSSGPEDFLEVVAGVKPEPDQVSTSEFPSRANC